jgi:stage III sporulation protein AF
VINAMSTWAKSIILAVIVSTIIQMILPEGNNKKYIKTVIGLYILFTIISPIISKISGGNSTIDVSKYENYFNVESTTTASANVIDKNLDNTYTSSIKADIKNRMKQKGYKVNSLDANIELKNEESYGTINNLKISLEREESNNNLNIQAVNKIEIKISNNTNEAKQNNLTSMEKQEIKNYLSETYSIKKENIEVD